MFFDATPPPEQGDEPPTDELWSDDAEQEAWAPEAPDAVDLVVEVADMLAVFAAQRLQRVDALRREAIADAGRYGLASIEIIERSVRLELAAALRITEHAAGDLMAFADAVVGRYPEVLDSLSHARMTEDHARFLVATADQVEPELREDILQRGIELAEEHSVGTFRRALRKFVETARAATLTDRFEEALGARRVFVERVADGMAWLHMLAPEVEVHAAHGRATAIAKVLSVQDGETRTLDQLRADVMCDLLIDGDTTSHPEQARGIRPTVVVTVPVLSLLDDAAAASSPATVEGIGPIPIARARELCGGAKGWMRVLTHPETGMVLSVGRDQYRPPAALRRLVKWRAERCMTPGCGMPASRCQIDHQLAWEHGGLTALWNNTPFCEGHHTVKHHGGWIVRQLPGSGGTIEWTSPAGRRYLVHPERPVPTFRLDPGPPDDEGLPPF